ncbi:MAG: hypothetical protein AAGD09_03965 [Cyanobacteria bacterium P01_F01_bin.56]
MAITPLRKCLTAQTDDWADPQVLAWYGLSVLTAAYYGYLVLQTSFAGDYVIQDDARQHVFWMLRFVDASLLPNDLMADYFQSNAPVGYTLLYRTIAALGLHPFVFNKLLPVGLSLLTTHYCFRFSLQLLPVPAAAFISTLLLNQTLWMRDDIVSGTPRAFVYPLLLAFLVYLNGRAFWPCMGVLALQPLFYPHCALLSAGILVIQLWQVKEGKLGLVQDPQRYRFSAVGLGILVSLLAPYALEKSAFGPLISAAKARTMPEFAPGGRAAYFNDQPLFFWFGDRAGFIPTPVFTPPLLALSLGFPWLWGRSRSSAMSRLRSRAAILQPLVLSSFGLYFAAHLLLFRLHLPSRYTTHSLRIFFALTAGFTLWFIITALLRFWEVPGPDCWAAKIFSGAVLSLLIGLLLGYSALTQSFPVTANRYGRVPEMYEFLRQTPNDTTVASLTRETSNLHAFAQRSPLISPELGLPYHTGYYEQFRTRVGDLIDAQYSDNLEAVQDFIRRYDINFWLLDDKSFSPDFLADNKWFNQHQPEAQAAIAQLSDREAAPILEQAKTDCTVFETTLQGKALARLSERDAERLWLLDASCLLNLQQAAFSSGYFR